MSKRLSIEERRARRAKWWASVQEPHVTRFGEAWSVLAPLTVEECKRAIAHRAGLRGAFGEKMPNPPGTRAVSKLQRRAIQFRYGTQARRKLA